MRFPLDPDGYRYRSLRRTDPMLRGWDVYALQTAFPGISSDGYFGDETHEAIVYFQRHVGLKDDGIAGPVTQRGIGLSYMRPVQKQHKTPIGLMRGQINHESAFLLGNHSPSYVRSGVTRYDMGICQFSTLATDEDAARAFSVIPSVRELGAHLRRKKDEYYGQPGARRHKRAWKLAAGSWNAPAWTDTLARGGTLSESQQQWIDDYIAAVTVLVKRYNP